MKAIITNNNNHDFEHEIIFLNYVYFTSGKEKIHVLFDGREYGADVHFDSKGNRFFKHCGKVYDIALKF